MLINRSRETGVDLLFPVGINGISHDIDEAQYILDTTHGTSKSDSLVIATGGLSIPKSGATSFGYDIARQFGHEIVETRAGLVPLTFQGDLLERCKSLSGLSIDARISTAAKSFAEGLLFTHRGLSGPSILQISSYWQASTDLILDLSPGNDFETLFKARKRSHPKQQFQTMLTNYFPKRLASSLCELHGTHGRLGELSDRQLVTMAAALNAWRVRPGGTEGYRTAEVTLGGVDTHGLSSKTMASKHQPNLYFIGGGCGCHWASRGL